MSIGERILVFDPCKCTSCSICELTCSVAKERAFNSNKARLKVISEPDPANPDLLSCHMCDRPACVAACPTRAIEIGEGVGMVWIVKQDCTACRRCVSACPFGAINMWEGMLSPVVCDFCAGQPKCVQACPWAALQQSD